MEKEKNSIDQFFKESLREHEIVPSAKARDAFLKEASGITRRDPVLRRILPYLALVVLISAGTFLIGYFLKNRDGGQPIPDSQRQEVRRQIAPGNVPEKKAVDTPSSEESKGEDAKSIKVAGSATHPAKTIPATANLKSGSNTKNKSTQTQDKFILNTKVTQDHGKVSAAGHPMTAQIESAFPVEGEPAEPKSDEVIPAAITGITTVPDTIGNPPDKKNDTIASVPAAPPVEEKKKPTNKEWYLSMSAQYSPEYMFNTLENGKFINSFGIEGIFVFGNYSVRTGIGLSIGKGTNELAIEYNDYLGSYLKLDSMSFTWDAGIHNYLPNYYLSNQDVWDSLMLIDSLKVVKRYTYLQIPLILGYDVFHTERFSLGFRAGPLLSVLVNTKQLSEEYDPGMKKIIKVNNITPEQIDLNWQFMVGINTSFSISRRFLFELEPMAKYYFNSVYEKPDITKKPWSIGIRAALLIKLY